MCFDRCRNVSHGFVNNDFKCGVGEKMKILYGTTNKGKLQAMEKSVKPLNIELIGLNDLNCELPSINENGRMEYERKQIYGYHPSGPHRPNRQ